MFSLIIPCHFNKGSSIKDLCKTPVFRPLLPVHFFPRVAYSLLLLPCGLPHLAVDTVLRSGSVIVGIVTKVHQITMQALQPPLDYDDSPESKRNWFSNSASTGTDCCLMLSSKPNMLRTSSMACFVWTVGEGLVSWIQENIQMIVIVISGFLKRCLKAKHTSLFLAVLMLTAQDKPSNVLHTRIHVSTCTKHTSGKKRKHL